MGGHFDVVNLRKEKEKLEIITHKEDFWEEVSYANKTYQQLKNINKILKKYDDLLSNIDLLKELLDIEDVNDLEIDKIIKDVQDLEFNTLLNKEYDKDNCYLEIHPGAGGTESCDWANMLLRMYERFLDKNNFKYKIIDKQDGEEAGIKRSRRCRNKRRRFKNRCISFKWRRGTIS